MKQLTPYIVILFSFGLSSCIEFEQEKLTYIHDEERDELRITLTYEGIFGNLDKESIHKKTVTMSQLMKV